jgi:hypothetical protein
MFRKYLEAALFSVFLLSIVLAIGYQLFRGKPHPSPEISERRLSVDLMELRDRFNNDKGKVRVVLLLSPT